MQTMEFLRRAFIEARENTAPTPDIAKQGHAPRGYGYRRLNRFKTVNGKRYQLHATRGWKCTGRAA